MSGAESTRFTYFPSLSQVLAEYVPSLGKYVHHALGSMAFMSAKAFALASHSCFSAVLGAPLYSLYIPSQYRVEPGRGKGRGPKARDL